MKSLWKNTEVKKIQSDDLALRVYTSRLLGREPSLVLHGGGNTSVKSQVRTMLGDVEDVLYVKGSGWDLATIEKPGFAPVRMEALLKMARLDKLDDESMVRLQRAAMIDPYAPNPSVEAILHAIIPFKFVDHTHADAVVTITNTPSGRQKIRQIYADDIIIVPYVMPGFILAREIYRQTKDLDWTRVKGMILMNHGVFTFADDAKRSYENMIRIVSQAERYLKDNIPNVKHKKQRGQLDLRKLAMIRRTVSQVWGQPVITEVDGSADQVDFAGRKDIGRISQQGPLTPDHIIRTKRVPVILEQDPSKSVIKFQRAYEAYFKKYADKSLTCLDPAPRWGVWPGVGTLAFGRNVKETRIISDIKRHTTRAIVNAESLGGWRALPMKDLFDMEYWVLEQAKLKKSGSAPSLQGRIALVTGAASGIGRACVEKLVEQGAVVAALDIDSNVQRIFDSPSIMPMKVDMTKPRQILSAVETTVSRFGGIDIVVSNAGIFPASQPIDQLDDKTWDRSLAINLNAHKDLMKIAVPYLEEGIDPSIILIASKNVPAPGPGASAYSVAKAGLTQLGRVAALEMAPKGIRVNMLHPNAVFDTAIWTDEVLQKRARHYRMTVDEYKTSNLLGVEITSQHVADMVVTMAGPVFSRTTGEQIAIDGGNDRVI